MLTARFSRHARIAGDCPVCLYPLQGRNITKRPCEHMLCTPCYLDGVSMGFTDSSFNPDACAVCRDTICSKTRHGGTLMEHFPASKATVAPATATLKRKGAPQGPRPRSVGPSAGSAGDAGAEKRVSKLKRSKAKKRKLAIAKEMEEEGGFALLARGEVRRQGVFVPIGNERTCLPDALHVGMMDVRPSLQLQQSVTRSALVSEASDPTFAMAKLYAAQHGIDLKYDRTLNCPQRLFDRRQGTFLVQLQISTLAGVDYHYVAYLAAKGYVIDNEPGGKVPGVLDKDRCSNKEALKVFQGLFPRATKIFVKAVSELRIIKEQLQIDYDQHVISNPPTHEDLFIELYQQRVITKDELIECI